MRKKLEDFFFFFFSIDANQTSLDQTDIYSLEKIYSKILHEQSARHNQLLHVREQLNHLAELLLHENLFYLPYLLIPN